MNDIFGREIVPGLYKRTIGRPVEFTYEFNPNQIELYIVRIQGEKFVATDVDGNTYAIEDPGFYNRDRRRVGEGAIDSIDLIKIDKTNYKKLKTDLLNTKEKISKLFKIIEVNKANLSARGPKSLVDLEKYAKIEQDNNQGMVCG